MDKQSKIYITGHRGLVGSALEEALIERGYKKLLIASSTELDLRDSFATERFFMNERPDFVFHAAAKVGGIEANRTRPAEFIYDNLRIQMNVIDSAHKNGVKKLLFYGSNCMYPRNCIQPMKEEDLLTGKFEPTNDAFATAKIAGLKMCQAYNSQFGTDFITVIPANLFGPRDNFDPKASHFFASLIKKFYEGSVKNEPNVILWGTGKPRREALYVRDLADASIFLMENYKSSEPINIGTNQDYSIEEIARAIKEISKFKGEIVFDTSKRDGMPRKLLDSSKINSLGWRLPTSRVLEDSLRETYDWYLKNIV